MGLAEERAGKVVNLLFGGSSSSSGEYATAEEIWDRLKKGITYLRLPPDQTAYVSIGRIIGGHYSWNPEGFSIWVDAWRKAPTRWGGMEEEMRGMSFGHDVEGVQSALQYIATRFTAYTEEKWLEVGIPIRIAEELGWF